MVQHSALNTQRAPGTQHPAPESIRTRHPALSTQHPYYDGPHALSLACAAFFVGLRTASFDGFLREHADPVEPFMNNPG